jgi:hypothetical protein
VPEPTSYHGQNILEVLVDENFFKPALRKPPATAGQVKALAVDKEKFKSTVAEAMKTGFSDTRIFPNVRLPRANIKFVETSPMTTIGARTASTTISGARVAPTLAKLQPSDVAEQLQNGKRLVLHKALSGRITHRFVKEPAVATPRILLVESYRLSSYLGQYGAGRTIKTYSLLPGEKTKISIKTYKKTETDAKEASSILDSYTEETAEEFESAVQEEESLQQNEEKAFSYHADAEVGATWGWGNATVSGGVAGSNTSAREEFAKNVTSTTEKHSAKASAKRDISVETSYEVKEETGEETAIERQLENINVGRTLNFVFRQMNQEFITLLHLVDVRIGFFNGFSEISKEVPLSQMDALLEEVLNTPDQVQSVKADILNSIQSIKDYADRPVAFVEQVQVRERTGKISGYWRIKRDVVSTYKDAATGTEILVPGVLLAAKKIVMRTDGIIVEALLGQGDALDSYSHGLQEEAVRERKLKNDLTQAEIEKSRVGVTIAQSGDAQKASAYHQVFAEDGQEEEVEV